MTRIRASEARRDFSEILNRVAYKGERIVLHRRGKDAAALIPVEDLVRLEELEDAMDVQAAEEALEESDERIPYEQMRKDLGLSD